MEQVWFLFLYGWVPAALVVLWEAVRCLRTDWRGEWKFLAWMLGLLAADLILWLVGEPVLAAFGLAWRAWLVSFLQGAALVLVVVWTLLVGLSVLCRDEAYSVVRKIILGVSICVVIGSAVTEGLFSGLFPRWKSGWLPPRTGRWWRRTEDFWTPFMCIMSTMAP